MTTPENATANRCDIGFDTRENAVYVDCARFSADAVLPTVEAVCAAVAGADPDNNPCGLFCHPASQAETTLVFACDAMLYQEAIAMLVAEMHASCNNPAHVVVETQALVPARPVLAQAAAAHLKPFANGGYVADDRPQATWGWRCFRTADTSEDVLAALAALDGRLEIVA